MATFLDHILKRKRIISLKKIAHNEYVTSRGYSHLTMLCDFEKKIRIKLKDLERDLCLSQNDLCKYSLEMEKLVQTALERYIIESHLQEIPGIGPYFKECILTRVFRGHLQDLFYSSSYIKGIGSNLQSMINSWVVRYVGQIPTLLQGTFPGKEEIISKANIKIKIIQNKMDENIIYRNKLLEKQRIVRRCIDELQKVKEADFYSAILSPENANENLDAFQQGVFAEWEPIPDWFKEIFTVGEF